MSVETPETPVPSTLSEESQAELSAAVASIQDATLEDLFGKPLRTTSFYLTTAGPDGSPKQVRIRYKALPPKALDDLVALHQPTPKQVKDGAQWNPDTFPPALIAAVSLAPKISEEKAKELLADPNWSTGETNALFTNALNVCNAGLNVPFSAGD